MVRTQLYLDEGTHARLRALARRQGCTVSELVRSAVARTYGVSDPEQRLRTLRAIEGLWEDRRDVGRTDAYVRRLRRDTRPTRKRRA